MSKFVDFAKLKKNDKSRRNHSSTLHRFFYERELQVCNLNNPETKRELSTNTSSTAIEEIQQRNSRSSSVISVHWNNLPRK